MPRAGSSAGGEWSLGPAEWRLPVFLPIIMRSAAILKEKPSGRARPLKSVCLFQTSCRTGSRSTPPSGISAIWRRSTVPNSRSSRRRSMAGTRWPREIACHVNLGPTALEADLNAPAGLQPAGDIGPRPPGGIAGHSLLNHDRIMMLPATGALLGDGRHSPAPIELRLRHARGADRDQWRGKEKAEQQAVHGTVSLWRSDMASAAMRSSPPRSRSRSRASGD